MGWSGDVHERGVNPWIGENWDAKAHRGGRSGAELPTRAHGNRTRWMHTHTHVSLSSKARAIYSYGYSHV